MKTPAEKCAERIAEHVVKAILNGDGSLSAEAIAAIIQSEYAGPIQVAREAIKLGIERCSCYGTCNQCVPLRAAFEKLKQL